MKKLIIFLLFVISATAIGLYFRPDYPLIGQLDWINVLTKGHQSSTLGRVFSQGFIDESFYFVMRFTAGGAVLGVIAILMSGGKTKK